MSVATHIRFLQQAFYEISSGERMLDYFLQESAYLKTRLSQVTDDINDPAEIVTAEYFQTLFVQNDAHMNDVRNNVVKFKKMISEGLAGKLNHQQRAGQNLEFFKKDVAYFETHFNQLKNEFNLFLARLMSRLKV